MVTAPPCAAPTCTMLAPRPRHPPGGSGDKGRAWSKRTPRGEVLRPSCEDGSGHCMGRAVDH
eukprot:11570232-Alexandrium_andersonii.AAC.1